MSFISNLGSHRSLGRIAALLAAACCALGAAAPAAAGEPEHAPQWRVRTLDESRMRAALSGDAHAQMLAFGDAIEA